MSDTRQALDRAAYALFQLKRFAGMPQAAIDFCREEHEKACAVLNEDGLPGPNGEWIACSDRMPGNYITVLITDGDGIRSTAFWSGSHWSVDVVSERDAVVITPEYWMPLPAAPSIPATGMPQGEKP